MSAASICDSLRLCASVLSVIFDACDIYLRFAPIVVNLRKGSTFWTRMS